MSDKEPHFPKKAKFVQEYLIDLNATQAAIRAGYSENGASVTGNRLLADPKIAAQIAVAMEARAVRTAVTADRVLMELARIGLADLRQAFTQNGAILPPSEWSDEFAASVASVEVVTRNTDEKDEEGRVIVERTHKIKLWDKNSALEKIGKHLAMFIDRMEHTGKNGKELFPPLITFKTDGD